MVSFGGYWDRWPIKKGFPFSDCSANRIFWMVRFCHYFFGRCKFSCRAPAGTAGQFPHPEKGKNQISSLSAHSAAEAKLLRVVPFCTGPYLNFLDPTVIRNERARFFGFRARPRDQTQSVSRMRPLPPHSMIKEKKLRERNVKSEKLTTKKKNNFYIILIYLLPLSGGWGFPEPALRSRGIFE